MLSTAHTHTDLFSPASLTGPTGAEPEDKAVAVVVKVLTLTRTLGEDP